MAVAYVELRSVIMPDSEPSEYFVTDRPVDADDVKRIERVIEDGDCARCDNGDSCVAIDAAPIGYALFEDENGYEHARTIGFFVVDGRALCEDCFDEDPFYANYEIGKLL